MYAPFKYQVSDVGAIKSFPLHNERLAPNHFLRRADLYRAIKHLARRSVFKPQRIDLTEPIAQAKNDIDELVCAMNFAEPVGKIELRAEAVSIEEGKNSFPIPAVDKQIQVFEMPARVSIEFKGVPPAQKDWNGGLCETANDLAVECRHTVFRRRLWDETISVCRHHVSPKF